MFKQPIKVRKILHIVSWWPSKDQPFNGIFILNLIKGLAESSGDYKHLIIPFNHSLKNINFNTLYSIFSFFKNPEYAFIESTNVKVLPVKNIYFVHRISAQWQMLSLTKKVHQIVSSLPARPDLIHVHTCFPSLIPAYSISQKVGIPFLITEHSSKFPDSRFESLNYTDKKLNDILYTAAATIAVSETLKSRFTDPEQVRVIPNFINWDLPIVPVSKQRFEFLFIALLNEENKRLDVLVRAIHLLSRVRNDFKLNIVGDGVLKESYVVLAENLGCQDKIEWHGYVHEQQKKTIISRSSCLLVTSDYETFGLSILEALSFGLPVITTNCGGPGELVNEMNGIIVPPNDPEAFTKALHTMMDTYARYNPLDIQKRAYAKYSKQIICDEYIKLYNTLQLSQ